MPSSEYKSFDITQNQDPTQTLQMLAINLSVRKRFLLDAESAYHGDVTHRGINTQQFQRTFAHLKVFSSNFLRTIVDAYTARLIIQGFNIGTKEENQGAWDIFTANHLDKYVNMASREAMKFGECYLMVDPTTTVGDGYPRITVETPFQVVGWQDPSDRSQNICALKYWQAADGHVYANLFTTETVMKFKSPQSYFRWSEAGLQESEAIPAAIPWEQYEEYEHKLGKCPVFTIENQPTLTRGGVSDLDDLIPLQRAIDSTLKSMLLAYEYAAFPQKYALNVAVDRDSDGNPQIQQAMEAALSRFWAFPPPEDKNGPEPKVGDFTPAQISNFTAGIEEIVHQMSMISSMPAYRLMGKLANMSASAILAAEAGFIDACRIKQTDYSLGYENAMSMALEVAGKPAKQIEVTWKDPSAVSGANLSASLVALQTIGVPKRELFKIMGYGPQQIEELEEIIEEEAAKAQPETPEADPKQLANALDQLAGNNKANGSSSGDIAANVSADELQGEEEK